MKHTHMKIVTSVWSPRKCKKGKAVLGPTVTFSFTLQLIDFLDKQTDGKRKVKQKFGGRIEMGISKRGSISLHLSKICEISNDRS